VQFQIGGCPCKSRGAAEEGTSCQPSGSRQLSQKNPFSQSTNKKLEQDTKQLADLKKKPEQPHYVPKKAASGPVASRALASASAQAAAAAADISATGEATFIDKLKSAAEKSVLQAQSRILKVGIIFFERAQ
jgi:hypothetical protein